MGVKNGLFVRDLQPVFSAPALRPVKDSSGAMGAWLKQWLSGSANPLELKALRERYVTMRQAEEPGWEPPADYEAPEAESYLATLPPAPPYRRRRRPGSRTSKVESRKQEPEQQKQKRTTNTMSESEMKAVRKAQGQRLKAARKCAGWCVYGAGQALCAQLEIEPFVLNNLESGHESTEAMWKIINFLCINPDYIRTGEGAELIGTPPVPPATHGRTGKKSGGRRRVEGRKSKVEGRKKVEGRGTRVERLDACGSAGVEKEDEWEMAVDAVTAAKAALDEAKAAFARATARLNFLMGADV